ncbi:MAG: hypothetical protein ABIK09_08780 [Pseudomonadota bacterium]
MIRNWWTLALAFALLGCSGAGGASGDPALQKKLQELKVENQHLNQQLGALGNKAFDRASQAETKRNLKGASHVLRSSAGSLRFDALVLGPLQFKKKTGTFFLNIGQGTSRGGLDDHPSSLSTRQGAATPADTGHDQLKPEKKRKRKGKKKVKAKSDEHNVIIRKKGGN